MLEIDMQCSDNTLKDVQQGQCMFLVSNIMLSLFSNKGNGTKGFTSVACEAFITYKYKKKSFDRKFVIDLRYLKLQ